MDVYYEPTRLCSRGWGFCLEDEPSKVYDYPYPDKPPGVLYDAAHQCRLQYGSETEHCHGIEVRKLRLPHFFKNKTI